MLYIRFVRSIVNIFLRFWYRGGLKTQVHTCEVGNDYGDAVDDPNRSFRDLRCDNPRHFGESEEAGDTAQFCRRRFYHFDSPRRCCIESATSEDNAGAAPLAGSREQRYM